MSVDQNTPVKQKASDTKGKAAAPREAQDSSEDMEALVTPQMSIDFLCYGSLRYHYQCTVYSTYNTITDGE